MEVRNLEHTSSLAYNSVGGGERRKTPTVQNDPPCLSQALDDHDQQCHNPFNRAQDHSRVLTARTDPDSNPARALARSTPKSPPVVGTSARESALPTVRYRECQKNHAASSGGYVVDGCGEFMPSGEEGSREFYRCAACECHRSFHRKETEGEPPVFIHRQGPNGVFSLPYYARNNMLVPPPPLLQQPPIHHHRPIQPTAQFTPPPTLMMSFGGGGTAAESSTEDLNIFQSYDDDRNNGFGDLQKPKKRFRTKFNQEQKDRMLEFAERLGWRIQKQDEEEVQKFCAEINVKRQVFKVWMHNNKQATKKKQM